jgi:hypothetical protein
VFSSGLLDELNWVIRAVWPRSQGQCSSLVAKTPTCMGWRFC